MGIREVTAIFWTINDPSGLQGLMSEQFKSYLVIPCKNVYKELTPLEVSKSYVTDDDKRNVK